MGLDSVELVVEWEKYFKIEIPDKEAVKMETVQLAVDYISSQVNYSEQQTDIKEKIFEDFRNSVMGMGIISTLDLSDAIFKIVPMNDTATWQRISLETKLETPEFSMSGFLGNIVDKIFGEKDDTDSTTLDRYIDVLAAVNYEKIIDRDHIQSKYEVMVAVIGITIEKIGVSPFEVYLNSSFTKDLGID